MRRIFTFGISFNLSCLLVLLFFVTSTVKAQTPVEAYGKLSVSGNKIVDESGEPRQLQGMSLFWSQWEPEFYAYTSVQKLRDNWCTNIVRAAMATNDPAHGISVDASAEEQRVRTVVEAAIDLGMYVIIDFHHHHAHNHTQEAVDFFTRMARDYGDHPNVIYEIYNEPLDVSWSNTIKPYSETVISAIRAEDPDNLIICGTPKWSQDVDAASYDPITSSPNIAYTLHYYAGSHFGELRDKAVTAMNNGIALFVTEFGTVNADGGGGVNEASSNDWFNFLDQHDLSYCNWSLCDKAEGSAVLNPGTGPNDDWDSNLTTAGVFIKNRFTSNCPTYAPLIDCNGVEGGDARIDDCGECSGGNTGIEPNSTCETDCNGVLGGTAFVDDCNECVGGTTGNEPCSPSPYNGTPHIIPGRIEAEEYDFGAYNDRSPENQGASNFRNDAVDIEPVSGNGHAIGYTDIEEWLDYSVSVENSGQYEIEFRTSSGQGNGSYRVLLDEQEIVPATNAEQFGVDSDWNAYGIQKSSVIDLEAGEYTLRFEIIEGAFNLDYMEFVPLTITGNTSGSNSEIKLMPNPVNNYLTITNLGNNSWKIFNSLGKVVKTGSEERVNMSNLPTGVYLIEVNGVVKQVIKN